LLPERFLIAQTISYYPSVDATAPLSRVNHPQQSFCLSVYGLCAFGGFLKKHSPAEMFVEERVYSIFSWKTAKEEYKY